MDQIKKNVTYHLGLTYEALGEHEKAVTEYKKIAAVDFGFREQSVKGDTQRYVLDLADFDPLTTHVENCSRSE